MSVTNSRESTGLVAELRTVTRFQASVPGHVSLSGSRQNCTSSSPLIDLELFRTNNYRRQSGCIYRDVESHVVHQCTTVESFDGLCIEISPTTSNLVEYHGPIMQCSDDVCDNIGPYTQVTS